MSDRTRLGLDGVDIGIHIGATVSLVLGFVASFAVDHSGPLFPAALVSVSLILLAFRRALIRRSSPAPGVTTGEMAAERIAELEQRVYELEAAQGRIAELEERLDFTERLLARGPEAQRVMPKGEPHD